MTGLGACAPDPATPPDATPWLRTPKLRKFMGKQDRMAVIAAGLAMRHAGGDPQRLRERTGLYLAVGHIPFEREDILPLAANSSDGYGFSAERFSTVGVGSVNPLLTFRCLPNMPAFHVSLNHGITGPSFTTYPGPGQFCLALEQAAWALRDGRIDLALVGGVADQENYLVGFHRSRCAPGGDAGRFRDGAGFLCLERAADAGDRGLLRLESLRLSYAPPDPFAAGSADDERWSVPGPVERFGAASVPIALERHLRNGIPQRISYALRAADGVEAAVDWSAP